MTVAMEAPSQIFRIDGIPSGTSLEALESLFADADRAAIRPKSLAVSPQNKNQSVATVAFTAHEGNFRYPQLDAAASNLTVDDDFEGLTVFCSPDDHQAEIIAVSDLFEHPFYSWASSADRAWLRDSLPRDVPSARVMLYGHDVELHSEKGLLEACAETFLKRLAAAIPENSSEKPIVLLGYRTGCLVIEKALLIARAQPDSALAKNLAMAVFFDASHSGLPEQFLNLLPEGKSKNVITNELREGSDTLRQLDADFSQTIGKTPVVRCISRVNYQEIDYTTAWKPSRTIVHEGAKETIAQLRRTHMGQYHQILEEIRRSLGSETANGVKKAPDSFINFSKPGRVQSPLSSPTSEVRRRDSILGTPEASPKVGRHRSPVNPRYNGYDMKPLPKTPSRRFSTVFPQSVLQFISDAADKMARSTQKDASTPLSTDMPTSPEPVTPSAKNDMSEAPLPTPPLSGSPLLSRPHARTSSISSQAIPTLKALSDNPTTFVPSKDDMNFRFSFASPRDAQMHQSRPSSRSSRYEDQLYVTRTPETGTSSGTSNSNSDNSVRRSSISSTTSISNPDNQSSDLKASARPSLNRPSLNRPSLSRPSLSRPSLSRATTLPNIIVRPFKRALTASSTTSPTIIPEETEPSEEALRLFSAIDSNDLDYIRTLLNDSTTAKASLRLTSPDGSGNTLLHYAAMQDNRPLAKLLLSSTTKSKPKTDVRNAARQTPLHVAALHDNVEVIRLLCSVHVDANKNALDGDGNTPLMVAAKQGNLEAVMSLCRNGAPASERRWDGRRAVDVARAKMEKAATGPASPSASVKSPSASVKSPSVSIKGTSSGFFDDKDKDGVAAAGVRGGQWEGVVKYLEWREKQDSTVAWPGLF